MIMLSVGKVQAYIGHGKGKTTAALGLALRAAGCGLRAAIVFFDKGGDHYSERHSLAKLGIDWWSTGLPRFDEEKKTFRMGVTKADQEAGRQGLDIARQILQNKKYDILILDEINSSVALDIVELQEVIALLAYKPVEMEVVMTGRDAPAELLALADLVTEMQPHKHYYQQGVEARAGIEY
ncbi:MAG: cob(I)yrinic acid a,c-diamide adenosyltransferase [Candidatus Komeilibacteria bacterium]